MGLFQAYRTTGDWIWYSVILARLLLPEKFGLIAMLVIFVSHAQALFASGFDVAATSK